MKKTAILTLIALTMFLFMAGCKKDGDIFVIGDGGWTSDVGDWTHVSPEGRGGVDFPTSRYYHAMAYDSLRGVTVLFGGSNGSINHCDTWEYDGSVWTNVSPSGTPGVDYPSPRSGHAMVYDPVNNMTVLFGGVHSNEFYSDTWVWNGSVWSNVTPSGSEGVDFPPRRYRHTLAFDPVNNNILLFGGENTILGILEDAWAWSGTAWSQVALSGSPDTDHPSGRKGHVMVTDSVNSLVLLFGGYNWTTGIYSDLWEWNGSAWTDVSPGGSEGIDYPTGRQNLVAAYNSTSELFTIYGGKDNSDNKLFNMWEWNGSNWTIRPVAGGLPYRDYPETVVFSSMVYDTTRNRAVLFGGLFQDNNASYRGDSTWEWDGVEWTNVTPGAAAGTDMPLRRVEFEMKFFPGRDVSVMFGGRGYYMVYHTDTWEWNGDLWSKVSPSSGEVEGTDYPMGRAGHGMAYDSVNDAIMLFGGRNPFVDVPNQTWLWSGTVWSKVAYATSAIEGVDYPDMRTGHSMVHDSARGNIVLFGGVGWNNFSDTWLWDGVEWSKVSPAMGQVEGVDYPESRANHRMVFDSKRGVGVLFGGSSTYGARNDIWEWNGNSWSKVNVVGIPGVDYPEQRFNMSMAYDATLGATVLFGGYNIISPLIYSYSDTWLWDGKSWHNVTPTGISGIDFPAASYSQAMTYDSARGKVVLFGGIKDLLFSSDTWEY